MTIHSLQMAGPQVLVQREASLVEGRPLGLTIDALLVIGFKEMMRVADSVQIFHRDRRDEVQDSLLQRRGEMVQAGGIMNHSKETGSGSRREDPGLSILSGLRIL